MELIIQNLHVDSPKGVEILKGISLTLEAGKLTAIMGPNGSGKSTLAHTLAGNPAFRVTAGSVRYDGKDLLSMSPEERARAGFFLAFQHPLAVPGVTIGAFLKQALRSCEGSAIPLKEINLRIEKAVKSLSLEKQFLDRYLNDNVSGGEKKKSEILQLAVLRPRVVVLDETDSGLDVDSLKVVSEGIEQLRSQNPQMAVGVITHYQRILCYLQPDVVYVLVDGKIVKKGGGELAEELEKSGYEKFKSSSQTRISGSRNKQLKQKDRHRERV